MIRLFIEEIDGESVIRFTPELAAEIGASVGDVLIIDRGSVKVQASKPETERQMAVAMKLMHEHREVLAALAKT